MGRFVLYRKKVKWTATWLGNSLKVFILFLVAFVFIKTIHPFLAENNPVESKTMVLEGFIPDYAVEEAKDIFIKDNYDLLLITGKTRAKGSHLDIYENDGEFSAATLEKLGFDMAKVLVVPVEHTVTKDRTYESGKAVMASLASLPHVTSFNLVSIGCHGRRSRYLFEMSDDKEINIGIISIENQGYNPYKWWQTSVGFRDVMQETIAWTYARFFFYPET